MYDLSNSFFVFDHISKHEKANQSRGTLLKHTERVVQMVFFE